MEVLILNGSPKKTGEVAGILKEISKHLEGKAETEWVNVYDLNMSPCIGCRGCRKNDTECVQREDDAQRIGRKITEAKALVIGTPTHFSNMSSPLKNLLDRNGTTLFTEPKSGMPIPKHKGKPAIIVTACMTPWPLNVVLGMSTGAIKSVKTYLKLGGFSTLGSITKAGTKNDTTIGPALQQKAKRLGKKMVSKIAVK